MGISLVRFHDHDSGVFLIWAHRNMGFSHFGDTICEFCYLGLLSAKMEHVAVVTRAVTMYAVRGIGSKTPYFERHKAP
jgi:hypothetical protein